MCRIDFVSDQLAFFRDDLFPDLGGGNKCRKMRYIGEHIKENGYNAVVTTGGVQSNHNRATAVWCSKNNIPCHLVIHGSESRFNLEAGNPRIIKYTNASVEFVEENEISDSMDCAMENFRCKGLKPYYLTGGGHDIHGGKAYADVTVELIKECERMSWIPDFIVVTCGTGSTMAGVMLGLDLAGYNDINVVGISIARNKKRAIEVTKGFYDDLSQEFCKGLGDRVPLIYDDYTFGGYEKTSKYLDDFLLNKSRQLGIVFDNTYTGKTLWGMNDLLEKGVLHGKILFLHTGGLMNIMK